MGKYFGTDGFRGEANVNLTVDHARKVGRFLGWYYGQLKKQRGDDIPAKVVIGKDTRRSSYMFEYALVAGLTASGADAYLLHVTTTPSVAYVARTEDFDCGIMISASHNPYYDNGIKLINGNGEKMDEATINLVEAYLDSELEVFGQKYEEIPFAHKDAIGCTVDYAAGRNRYMGYLISLGLYSFKGMKVGLDCANGSSWNMAQQIFDSLGAKTFVINAEPDGTNINRDAGSTHIEGLQKYVVENGLDVGFAYDGDADRCLCVDEKGNVRVNGTGTAIITATSGLLTDSVVIAGIDKETVTDTGNGPVSEPALPVYIPDGNGGVVPKETKAPENDNNDNTSQETTATVERETGSGTNIPDVIPTNPDRTEETESKDNYKDILMNTITSLGYKRYKQDMDFAYIYEEDGNYLGEVIIDDNQVQIYVQTRTMGFDNALIELIKCVCGNESNNVFRAFTEAQDNKTIIANGHTIRIRPASDSGHSKLIISY